MRPTDVPDQGLLCDLLWSDPDKDQNGWGENDRGVSFTFGAEVCTNLFYSGHYLIFKNYKNQCDMIHKYFYCNFIVLHDTNQ